MPTKEVYLYDTSNNPLRVQGIRVELFDTAGTLLDSKNSVDLNPGSGGNPSNEWGVRLTFKSSTNPVEIYFSDPNYLYPGHTVRSLNGQLADRLDVDLLQVPVGFGGQPSPPSTATPASLSQWVTQGDRWSIEGKQAVLNLIFNYMSVIVPRLDDLPTLEGLNSVAENWTTTLERLGIFTELFSS